MLPGQIGLSEMINAMAASQPIYAVQAAPGHYPIEALAQYPHPQYVQQGHYLAPVSAAGPLHPGVIRGHPGLAQQAQHPGLRGHPGMPPGPPAMAPGPRPDSNGRVYTPAPPINEELPISGSSHSNGGNPHSNRHGSNNGGSSSSRNGGDGGGGDGGSGETRANQEEGSYERERRSDRSREHRRDPRDYKDRRERSDRRDYRDRSDRGRDRDFDRFDRRSRERDFDRDRDRGDRDRDRGDRDRDRDSRNDRGDRRERYRDDERVGSPRRGGERGHGDHYERDCYDDDRPVDYRSMPPNNTIMVRGLAQHISENDIRDDILSCGLTPKDIRLVRRKESGASRGFAFVEFSTVHDATRWMEAKQGVLLVNDAYRATLQYSIPKDGADRQAKASQDWMCVRCGVHNFKRRDNCFKCSAPRHESEAGDDGSEEACNYPTYKLVLRGLDVLTTEEGVLQAIQHASTDLPIKSVRIGRDPLTNISRGVCFVELDSVYDAMTLFNKLMSRPPAIDGKTINISYCKLANNQHSSSSMAKPNNSEYWGGSAPNPPNPPSQNQMPQTTDIAELAEYSAGLYAQNPEEHAAYVQYYTQYFTQQQEQGTTQSDSVNAAAAVAQSALQAMQHKTAAAAANNNNNNNHHHHSSSSSNATTAPSSSSAITSSSTPTGTAGAAADFPQYPTPDVSTYQYDETSGYYYDPSTGLYYDSNTSYYYNSETSQFLYWDRDRSTYLPAPLGDDDQGTKQNPGEKKEKDKDKQEKVKVAKKIAKDMERWAKAQNKRNESGKVAGDQPVGAGGDPAAGTGAADAAFAVLLERRVPGTPTPAPPLTLKMQLKKDPSIPNQGALKKSGLVAAYGDEASDSGEEESTTAATQANNIDNNATLNEDDLLDLSKMACLLCKRQFANRDALNRHVQLSGLHKTNLEALRGAGGGEGVDEDSQQYRDRAQERRKKYGMPNKPPPNKLKEKYMSVRDEISSVNYEEPTKRGIGSDNIGNKLLKKMGWADGQGLGKSNQGRTEIIEAERRVTAAGLGVQGSNYTVVGDSYKDCVKKMMYHRYQELDAQEKDTLS